jgi:hypothetical protein
MNIIQFNFPFCYREEIALQMKRGEIKYLDITSRCQQQLIVKILVNYLLQKTNYLKD